MSELEARFVKTGLWVNENYDLVHRMVITTDTQTGIIIIALLAILSAIGTTHLWHLVSFAYHQYRADGKAKDGLFRQQQALLRQSTTPTSIMIDTLKLWWSWRNRTDRALVRTLIPFSLSVVCAIGTIAASIASSFVVDTSNLEVLVRSPFCGRPLREYYQPLPIVPYLTLVGHLSWQYAQDCYPTYMQGNPAFPSRCGVFVRPNVNLPTIEMTECPFAPNMCVGTKDAPSAALTIDSGLVDINDLFGLNLSRQERVKFRKRTTCGVLPVDEHIKVTKAANHPIQFNEAICPDEEILLLQHSPRTTYVSLLSTNMTYRATTMQGFIKSSSPDLAEEYDVPITELRRSDADVEMIYVVKNKLMFMNQTDDPIFSSHKRTIQTFEAGAVEFYLADDPVTPVACVQQYQFCIASPSGDLCSTLSGLPNDARKLNFPEIKDIQEAVLNTLIDSSLQFSMATSEELKINSRVLGEGLINSKVPETQWMTEIVNWESVIWSALQISISDYAVGPQLRTAEDLNITKPDTKGELKLCDAQRMRKNSGFVNINVFGLIFIIAVSCLAAIVDITLLKFLIYVSRFRKALAPRIERWIQDGILQLQRRAYEARGASTWTYLEKDVPVTIGPDKLPDLPVETLPLLRKHGLITERTWSQPTFINTPSVPSLHMDPGDEDRIKRLLRRSTSFNSFT